MSERYQENTRRNKRIEDVRTVLGYLTNRFNTQPFPAMSDHYRTEDEILMGDFVEDEYEPSPTVVPDERTGFDASGHYHCPGGRWTDQGTYLDPVDRGWDVT